ncbi:hypothetical protein [Cupriavidus sp. BIS7]|nr:hypothetical protein [Cupriavidus sp. BIS7]
MSIIKSGIFSLLLFVAFAAIGGTAHAQGVDYARTAMASAA